MRKAIAQGIWAVAAILTVAGSADWAAAEDAANPATKPVESMTAEQVLDKALEASGGKAAWEKVKTMEMKNVSETVTQGIKIVMRSTEISKTPGRHYVQGEAMGQKGEQGFDGKTGWAKDSTRGLRDLTGAELDQARRGALEANYNWKAYFAKAEYRGMEKVGDVEAYKIELTPKEGSPVMRWYDAKTFLLLQETSETLQGETEMTIKYRKYRDVEGLKIPSRMVVETPGGNMTVKLESIKINGPVDDAKFQKPADDEAEAEETEKTQKAPAPKQQPKNAPGGEFDADLRTELLGMAQKDQAARTGKGDEDMGTVDAKNTARLKEIIKKHGWPGKSLVREDGAVAAWMIVQHANNVKFQKKCLALMQEGLKKGEVSPQNVAYLEDRTRVNEGKKQLYGTQAGPSGPLPLEDAEHVDERRKAMGLPPMEEYLRLIKAVQSGGARKE